MDENKLKDIVQKIRQPKVLVTFTILSVVFINVLIFVLYVQPARSVNLLMTNDFQTKTTQLASLLMVEEEELPDPISKKEIDELLKQLPIQLDISELISTLNALAKEKQLFFSSYKIAKADTVKNNELDQKASDPAKSEDNENKRENVQSQEITIHVLGYMASTLDFMNELKGLAPLMEIDSWTYTSTTLESHYEPFFLQQGTNEHEQEKPFYTTSIQLKVFTMPNNKHVFQSEASSIEIAPLSEAEAGLRELYPELDLQAQ